MNITRPSDTPRSDARSNEIGMSGVDWHYSATLMLDFARQLERELRMKDQPLCEALRIACGQEVTRDHADMFTINFKDHECGCEVCAKSTKLCPATQSSLAQGIFARALSMLEANQQ